MSSFLLPGRGHTRSPCGRDPSRAAGWHGERRTAPGFRGWNSPMAARRRPSKGGNRFMKAMRRKIALLSLLSLPAMLLVAAGGPAAAAPHTGAAVVTSSSLGSFKPTFTGPAATGCAASGCHLLTGPFRTPSVAHLSASQARSGQSKSLDRARALPLLRPHVPGLANAPTVQIPTVSCQPLRAGCDNISPFAGGAVGVKGINAVDSAESTTNKFKDVEPPDQGLCAGNGSVVETNNIGEILIFNKALKRASPVISLDRVMGLGKRQWSSGGDVSCVFDSANGGHWFISEFVSKSPESKGGPFAGCFAAVANTCLEGIAVTTARARSARTTSTSSMPTSTRRSQAFPSCSTTSRRPRPPGTRSCCS